MAISGSKSNNIVSGERYTFPVNCDGCSYYDIKIGCVFSRCVYLELPKPNVLSVTRECAICKKETIFPIYSNATICTECAIKLQELINKDGEADDGK